MSFKEQQELEKLPALLDELEAKKAALTAEMNAPTFYKQEQTLVNNALNAFQNLEKELANCYARWNELEENAG